MPEYALFENRLTHTSERVEVCDRYEGFAVVKQGEKVFSASLRDLTPINEQDTAYSFPPPTPLLSLPALPEPPGGDVATQTIDVAADSSVMQDLYLNQADKNQLAKALAGIGKTYAGRIVDRKPEGGYKSWEHLIEVNNDFSVNWTEVRQDTPYVVIF